MQASNYPLVSIGLPVFNGGSKLKRALDSLVHQSYPNIEIIISDNGSDDSTQEIAEKYARKYDAIKFFHHEITRDAPWNFNKVFSLTTGHYFMWAAHDDWWHHDYITECVSKLQKHHSAVLCFTQITRVFIDQDNKELLTDEKQICTQNIKSSYKRLYGFISKQNTAIPIYGLIRKESLDKTALFQLYLGSDRGLLSQLAILGEFVCVDKPLIWIERYTKTAEDFYASIGKTKKARIFPKHEEMAGVLKSIIRMNIKYYRKPLFLPIIIFGYYKRYGYLMKKEIRRFIGL